MARRARPRSEVHAPRTDQEPRLHRYRDRDVGARHRREHDHLHRRRRGAAAAARLRRLRRHLPRLHGRHRRSAARHDGSSAHRSDRRGRGRPDSGRVLRFLLRAVGGERRGHGVRAQRIPSLGRVLRRLYRAVAHGPRIPAARGLPQHDLELSNVARRVRLRSRHHREADSCRQRPAERHRRGSRGLRVSRRHGDVDEGLHGATGPTTAALQPVGLRARAARRLLGSGAGAARRLRSPDREMAGRPEARVRCATVARGRRRRPAADVVDRVRGDGASPVDRLHQRGEPAARARRGSLERVRAARGDGRAPVARVSPAHDRELRPLHSWEESSASVSR